MLLTDIPSKRSWLQSLVINVVKCGELPKNVGFLMDGNRRYAKKHNIPLVDAHKAGFKKYDEVIDWCLAFGIPEASIFFASVKNFRRRSEEEVGYLLKEIKGAFQRIIDSADHLARLGVQVRAIGKISILSEDLQKTIAQAVLSTKNNKGFRLTIAVAYSGKAEVTQAVDKIVSAFQNGSILSTDITTDLIDAVMFTEDSRPPDVLIRTSGEVRTSDYLPWQASHCLLHFIPVLWPAFSFWDFINAILQYQRGHPARSATRRPLSKQAESLVQELYRRREADLLLLTTSEDTKEVN